MWTVHQWGEVFPEVVDDLRWALREVGDHDSRERCELMLALAVELYYEPSASAEIAALVDEGVLIARRVGRPDLVWWASRAGWAR